MKTVILGGVAAGCKTAAKLKREDPSCEIVIYTKGSQISYAGCGLPYYIGDVIHEKEALIVNTPEMFEQLTGVKVWTQMEALSIHPEKKEVIIRSLVHDTLESVSYDKLVIATGARAFVPPLEGITLDHVYTLRTPDDAIQIRSAVEDGSIKRACIVGAGLIGMELAENLIRREVRVSVIEMGPHILPMFDPEISDALESIANEAGIMTFTDTKAESVTGEGKVEKIVTSRRPMKCDAVIFTAGIRANTEFLDGSGIALHPDKTIIVDEFMQTNIPDIYACGDCVRVQDRITKQTVHAAMGSVANLSARCLAKTIAGKPTAYQGTLGTAILKMGEVNAGKVGLTETQAKDYDTVSVLMSADDKAAYYPDAGNFIIKLTADKISKRLLGAQVYGKGNVDKIVDLCVAAISKEAVLSDLDDLDFAYAPPFSTAIHPLVQAVQVLENKMDETMISISPLELESYKEQGYTIVDTSKVPAIKGASYLDFTKLDESLSDEKRILVCNRGRRAYLTQNKLMQQGFKNSVVLEGGTMFTPLDQEQ